MWNLSNGDYNWTEYEFEYEYENPEEFQAGTEHVFWILLFLSTIANGIVLLIRLLCRRHLGQTFYTLIANLSCADLVLAFFGSLFSIFASDWRFGIVVCKVSYWMINMCYIVRVYTLVLLAGDRVYVALRPSTVVGTSGQSRFIIVVLMCLWGISALGTLPSLLWQTVANIGYNSNKTVCITDQSGLQAIVYDVLYFGIGFALPLCVITLIHIPIGLKLLRSAGTRDVMDPLQIQKQRACIVLVLCTIFFVCWTPFLSLRIIMRFVPQSAIDFQAVVITSYVASCFAYGSLCLGLGLYVIMSPHFRRCARSLVPCVKHPDIQPETEVSHAGRRHNLDDTAF